MKDYSNLFARESLTDGIKLSEMTDLKNKINEMNNEIQELNNKIKELFEKLAGYSKKK